MLKIRHLLTFATLLALFVVPAYAQDEEAASTDETSAEEAQPAQETFPLSPEMAPEDIDWQTNYDDPPIGDPAALKGGTFFTYMDDYPLTFRLMGPNSNDSFAGWNRSFTMDFALVARHPETDNYIPWLATHWAVMDDNRTVYYKLDSDAKWSDGVPVTAKDVVFAWEMFKSPYIVDPFYNQYANDYYEEVKAIDDHVVKIVGRRPSWRPLADYNLFAMPAHFYTLDDNYVNDYNNKYPIVVGPYHITAAESGKKVVFSRIKDWWGKDKHYWKGMWNADEIVIKVIPVERALDYFQKGELSFYTVTTAAIWAEKLEKDNFPPFGDGWVHKKREFVEVPSGIYGLNMNLSVPIFQNKHFRKALQYLFNFDELNQKLMYNAYYRQVSAFEGTEYENKDLKPYGFDPKKAREELIKAGYVKRGQDGIFINKDTGQRASFELIYGSKSMERHMTVIKEGYKKFGIEVNLKVLSPATAFEYGLERKFEMIMTGRTAGFYPSPYQYFSSEFVKTTNNNNIWGFGSPETDKLIDVYRFDMDKQKRMDAMHKLDEIIQDEAFYIPFWDAPYIRFMYWDNLCFPEGYFPRRTEQYTDWAVYWIDPDKEARLKEAMQAGTKLPFDSVIDVDPYGLQAQYSTKE
ncbi:extracellular solute-binding protein [bacterium]|nr:extracellular solute-binding protein [bacterium]